MHIIKKFLENLYELKIVENWLIIRVVQKRKKSAQNRIIFQFMTNKLENRLINIKFRKNRKIFKIDKKKNKNYIIWIKNFKFFHKMNNID